MDLVILECLLVHAALGIPVRLVLAQVTKQYKDVIDASWFQLVTSDVMHTLFRLGHVASSRLSWSNTGIGKRMIG